ncbi:MAG: gamma-glutamyl-gamma-aminobutyrate hydrolase family protein [Candidatus Marsarchaeota archaeon]|nr:gamma-glutamyl-gamma-aminobutyrate hydrolase family protein [Candidatus Marsarchaeota archaeon]
MVPGGFGKRGIEGMINAIKYARESKTPYLGICLGMQLMAIEYARNVCKLNDSNSTEFNPNVEHKIIYTMPSQRRTQYKGATMRLGAWDCKINKTESIAYRSYKKDIISERHRHRFEFNNKYREIMEKNGLIISATTPDDELVEMIEWNDRFGIGTQAHPELKSRLYEPAPLFFSLIENAIVHKYNK